MGAAGLGRALGFGRASGRAVAHRRAAPFPRPPSSSTRVDMIIVTVPGALVEMVFESIRPGTTRVWSSPKSMLGGSYWFVTRCFFRRLGRRRPDPDDAKLLCRGAISALVAGLCSCELAIGWIDMTGFPNMFEDPGTFGMQVTDAVDHLLVLLAHSSARRSTGLDFQRLGGEVFWWSGWCSWLVAGLQGAGRRSRRRAADRSSWIVGDFQNMVLLNIGPSSLGVHAFVPKSPAWTGIYPARPNGTGARPSSGRATGASCRGCSRAEGAPQAAGHAATGGPDAEPDRPVRARRS